MRRGIVRPTAWTPASLYAFLAMTCADRECAARLKRLCAAAVLVTDANQQRCRFAACSWGLRVWTAATQRRELLRQVLDGVAGLGAGLPCLCLSAASPLRSSGRGWCVWSPTKGGHLRRLSEVMCCRSSSVVESRVVRPLWLVDKFWPAPWTRIW